MTRPPDQRLAYLVIGCAFLFGAYYTATGVQDLQGAHVAWWMLGLLVVKGAIEIGASIYSFSHLFLSVAYLGLKSGDERDPSTHALPPLASLPPVGIIYLCCNDLDSNALTSLAHIDYAGKTVLVVHDDSSMAEVQAEVNRTVELLRQESACEILLLRRPQREGGKPGAVNYVLEQTGHLYEYFLLCDNDSTAVDPTIIDKALPYFQDERIAVVQGRNVRMDSPGYAEVNRRLSYSIDSFHLFLAVYQRFGWRPFVGHNAFLRTRYVEDVGGLTPGFFSDDLDLTVRLNLRGYTIAYAPEIQVAETHPPSYTALRKRSYKWAYGCTQTLKAHSGAVLTSRRLTLAEKLFFFQFSGFFMGQSFLLLYLILTFLVLPALGAPSALGTPLPVSAAMVVGVFLPTLTYFGAHRVLRQRLSSVLLCGVVYGTTDFSSFLGVWDCLWNRKRQWIPTNQRSPRSNRSLFMSEALFGVLLLSVPLILASPLLYLPSSYLFVGKFLFAPAISLLYDDTRRVQSRVIFPWLVKAKAPTLLLLVAFMLALTGIQAQAQESPAAVEIRGQELYVDNRPFTVQGIHYGPWRPGTGPGKDYPYPEPALIEADLQLISQLHANTIAVYDPPDYVLDLAETYDLKVLYTFYVEWWTLGTPAFAPYQAEILARVESYRHKPALLAWVLGNEVPVVVLEERGEEVIVKGLEELYQAIKAVDAQHPITHANWPPARRLDLSFLDMISFNVYPLWPPEVAARGFGNFVQEVLQPIAGEKPLLITEFGVNTIEGGEEGQARLLRQSWEELQATDAIGGIVFGFADEWWKNYDNPKQPPNWWDRTLAPDDEAQHDEDPEESYGIMTSDRQPKAAYAVVQTMFAGRRQLPENTVPVTVVGSLVILAFGSWWWARSTTPEAKHGHEDEGTNG